MSARRRDAMKGKTKRPIPTPREAPTPRGGAAPKVTHRERGL